jgi:hypothetical protein
VKRLLVFLPLLLAACAPQLSAITPAPPGRSLLLDADDDRIELSEAVAVAAVSAASVNNGSSNAKPRPARRLSPPLESFARARPRLA